MSATKKIVNKALPLDEMLEMIKTKPIDQLFSIEEKKPANGKTWKVRIFSISFMKDGQAHPISVAISDNFKITKVKAEANERGEFKPQVFSTRRECPKLYALFEAIDKYILDYIKKGNIKLTKTQQYFESAQTHYPDSMLVPESHRGKEIVNSKGEPEPRFKLHIDLTPKKYTTKQGKEETFTPTSIGIFQKGVGVKPATFGDLPLTNEHVGDVITRNSEILAIEIKIDSVTLSNPGLSLDRTIVKTMIAPAPERTNHKSPFDDLWEKKFQQMTFEEVGQQPPPQAQANKALAPTPTPTPPSASVTVKSGKETELYTDNDDEESEEESEGETTPPPKPTSKGKKSTPRSAVSGY